MTQTETTYNISVVNKQMIHLIDILKSIGKIKYRQEFLDAIHMKKQAFYQVERGMQTFTHEHVMLACKEYGVNANFIYAIEKKVFRD
jgi:hypothetical protein